MVFASEPSNMQKFIEIPLLMCKVRKERSPQTGVVCIIFWVGSDVT